MGIINQIFGSKQPIVSAVMNFDNSTAYGKITVHPGHDIDSSMHLLVLFQISKMLYVIPRKYSFTKDFINTYLSVCDDKYISDKSRFKTALLNNYGNESGYFFYQSNNCKERFESELCIVSKTDIKFETKIPVFGGRTNAALSTPLVLLSLIEQADNRDLMIKIQSSVRLMCVKYLNGYDYANLSNSTKLPFEIFDMSK